MSWFWCEKHAVAHRKGDDKRACLLVGPYSTKYAAEGFVGPIRKHKAKRACSSTTDQKKR